MADISATNGGLVPDPRQGPAGQNYVNAVRADLEKQTAEAKRPMMGRARNGVVPYNPADPIGSVKASIQKKG